MSDFLKSDIYWQHLRKYSATAAAGGRPMTANEAGAEIDKLARELTLRFSHVTYEAAVVLILDQAPALKKAYAQVTDTKGAKQ